MFINLIHDIDLFRHLLGEIVAVQARESNALRGNAVEETAVILLEFASGALGTVTVSDAVAAPWSWELTAGENPAYPRQDQSCYQIGGTRARSPFPGSRSGPMAASPAGGSRWSASACPSRPTIRSRLRSAISVR